MFTILDTFFSKKCVYLEQIFVWNGFSSTSPCTRVHKTEKKFVSDEKMSKWWRWGGSNSWPPACKAGALPAELHPHFSKCHRFLPDYLSVIFHRLYRLPPDYSLFVSFAPHAFLFHSKALFHRETQLRNSTLSSKVLLVGLSGLEPPTSRLSGVRSNRLSYRPILS